MGRGRMQLSYRDPVSETWRMEWQPRALAVAVGLLGGGYRSSYFTNRSVNDGVEKLAMVSVGFSLDVFAGALPCFFAIGQIETASLGRDLGELLDDVEEGRFISACELPAVRDGAGENLLGRPVVRSGGVGRRLDRDIRLRLLS